MIFKNCLLNLLVLFPLFFFLNYWYYYLVYNFIFLVIDYTHPTRSRTLVLPHGGQELNHCTNSLLACLQYLTELIVVLLEVFVLCNMFYFF